MFFRYDYLDENRAGGEGLVGWYVVKIANPAQSAELSRTFDEMFANSPAETKTTTEKGFVEGFAKQIGDISTIMIAISSTVFFIFGLVAASTMAQSVRERTSELAVLKTLGFSGGAILMLVLAESLFIAVTGGAARSWAGVVVRAERRSHERDAAALHPARRATSSIGDRPHGSDRIARRRHARDGRDADADYRCVEAQLTP